MFKKLILGLCVFCLMCVAPVWAANNIEVTDDGRTIEISSLDEAWVSSTDTTYLSPNQNANGLYVYSIYFKPAGTDDECTVYSGSSTSGVIIFSFKCADAYDERIMYFPHDVRRHLYLADTDPTAGSMVIINLWKYGE